jgi:hypothetical protein
MQASRCSTGRPWLTDVGDVANVRSTGAVGRRARAAVIALAALASCTAPPGNTTRRWAAQDGDVLDPGGEGIDPSPAGGGGALSGTTTGGSGGFGAGGFGAGGSGAGGFAGNAGGAGGFGSGQGGSFGNTGGFGAGGFGAGGSGAGGYVPPPPPPADPILPPEPFKASGPPGPCSLAISVTTVPIGSDYSPLNIGAIWLTDSSGKFVKTLAVWANRRKRHLEAWNEATSAAGVAGDTVDAVTGSTARNHGTHTSTWNCTDFKKAQVPRGPYRLCMEMTEFNGAGPKGCIAFDNGGTAFRLMPPDIGSYKGRVLDYKPQ